MRKQNKSFKRKKDDEKEIYKKTDKEERDCRVGPGE